MNIKVEAYGLKIGVDNSVTEALYSGKWGVRIEVLAEDNTNRYEFVVTEQETYSLIGCLQRSLDSIYDVKERQKHA